MTDLLSASLLIHLSEWLPSLGRPPTTTPALGSGRGGAAFGSTAALGLRKVTRTLDVRVLRSEIA